MILTKYKSRPEAIKKLNALGFNHVFKLIKGKLMDIEDKKVYEPESVNLVEFHRFSEIRGEFNTSMIYVLECNDGKRGLMISAYKDHPGLELTKFLNKLKIKPI